MIAEQSLIDKTLYNLGNILSFALSTITSTFIVLLYFDTNRFFNKGTHLIDNGENLLNSLNMTELHIKLHEIMDLEQCAFDKLTSMGICKPLLNM